MVVHQGVALHAEGTWNGDAGQWAVRQVLSGVAPYLLGTRAGGGGTCGWEQSHPGARPTEPERAVAGHVGGSNLTPAHAPRNQNGRRQGTLLLKEPLKKDLSLSLGLGRIRLCEALCRADGVLFQGILELYRVSY